MGRGVSAGGGQSSLGYLFGNQETANSRSGAKRAVQAANNSPSLNPGAASQPFDKQVPAGIPGNFITDRPSTKVHAAPGGGFSIGYLFGRGGN